MHNEPVMERQEQPAAAPSVEKENGTPWFKIAVSTMIALVTIAGAWVAWRAQVAGSESGDYESDGLRAVQNYQEVRTRITIEVAEHYTAFLDFLENRTLALGAGVDLSAATDLTEEEELELYREFVTNLDLAATNKRYFFPGRYLSSNDSGDSYNYNTELLESYAAEERTRDLEPLKSFDRADALGGKVMGLLGMLVVLAVSLWLFAISEVMSTATRYGTALGGILFFGTGLYGAYSIENALGPTEGLIDDVWMMSWISGGITAVVAITLLVISLIRRRPKAITAAPPAYPQPPYDPSAPQMPQNINPAGPPMTQPFQGPPEGYPQTQAPLQHAAPNAYVASAAPAAPAKVRKEEKAEGRDELFKQMVLVFIATVALIASIIAFLQSEAGDKEGAANRNVQTDALDVLGNNTFGASATAFDYGAAVRVWKQLDVQARMADLFDDPSAAQRYRDAMNSVESLSPVFGEDYYDPATDTLPQRLAYEADIYKATSAQLTEEASIQLGLKNAWSQKASAYIAHLTLLAVSLALLGLSLATVGFVRYIFAGVGVLMVGITLVWSSVVYTQPVESIDTGAVSAYSEGYGLWLSGDTDGAIEKYTEALAIEPAYATALYARGNAYLDQGILAYRSGDYDLNEARYEDALKDYQATIDAGRDDVQVNWNMAWVYYLQGKYNEAININRHITELDPTVVAPRMNLALALLALGEYDEAEMEYNTAIARVSDQVTEANEGGTGLDRDFWYYLDAGVTDLDNLIDRIEGREYSYTLAPAADLIPNKEETVTRALDMILKLKSSTAGFEYLGAPPAGEVNVEVSNFTFMARSDEDNGEYVEWENNYFPYNTKTVRAKFAYAGLEQGQTVLFKLYQDTIEQPDYRLILTWGGTEEEGEYEFDISDPAMQFSSALFDPESEARFESLADYSNLYNFPPGDFTVEMYVDYNLVRRGVFSVEFPPAEESGQ